MDENQGEITKKTENFLQVQQFCDLLALGQKQAVFPGDGLENHNADNIDQNTHADGQTAENEPAGKYFLR